MKTRFLLFSLIASLGFAYFIIDQKATIESIVEKEVIEIQVPEKLAVPYILFDVFQIYFSK